MRTRRLTLDAGVLPEGATLNFKTRWQFQLSRGATGTVEISTDGGVEWTALTGTVFGTQRTLLEQNSPAYWGDASYDLSAYAGQEALVRFRYDMAAYTNGAGWSIDDVALSGRTGIVFSDDAESVDAAWTSVQWFRENNAFTKY